MSIFSAIKNGLDKIYTVSKNGIVKLSKWLIVKIPILAKAIVSGTKLLLKLLKGIVYGAYYGMKDGYNAWKGTENYIYSTCIDFKTEEEEPDEIIDEIPE